MSPGASNARNRTSSAAASPARCSPPSRNPNCTAREYREMPDNRAKYDLLHRDIERILRSGSQAAAINFYRAATGETPTNSRYAVEAIQADCEDDPFPPPPLPKPTPLPKPASSPATPLPPSPEPGNVRTVPADPATGTPHTTTILLSLLCAILLGGLFVSPPKADGHAVLTALSQFAASTFPGALTQSPTAMNAVVPASSAARPKTNPGVINHFPSTPPTHCSTTPRNNAETSSADTACTAGTAQEQKRLCPEAVSSTGERRSG